MKKNRHKKESLLNKRVLVKWNETFVGKESF